MKLPPRRLRLLASALLGAVTVLATALPSAAQVPNPPVGLSAQVSGAAARLTWSPPNGGATVSGYVIDAGSTSGASDLANGLVVGNVLSLDTPPLPPPHLLRARAGSERTGAERALDGNGVHHRRCPRSAH